MGVLCGSAGRQKRRDKILAGAVLDGTAPILLSADDTQAVLGTIPGWLPDQQHAPGKPGFHRSSDIRAVLTGTAVPPSSQDTDCVEDGVIDHPHDECPSESSPTPSGMAVFLGSENAKNAPRNPDRARLFWDPTKQAFRLRRPICECAGKCSSLTEEPLTCGHCDGRQVRPRRFQPGVDVRAERHCVYCGDMRGPVCLRCATIKSDLPANLGDDQTLVEVHRRLVAEDRRRLAQTEAAKIQKRRAINRRAVERRWQQKAAE